MYLRIHIWLCKTFIFCLQYFILEQDLCANSWRTCSEHFLCWVSPRTSYYLDWFRRWYVTGFFFIFWAVTHYLNAKPYFCPFFVRGTCTLYVITSRMYSGPRQKNYYFDDLSCLERLLYSNLWNVVFDFELAEALPINYYCNTCNRNY